MEDVGVFSASLWQIILGFTLAGLSFGVALAILGLSAKALLQAKP